MRLQDLIIKRRGELGRTYTQLVEISEKAGFRVSRTMWHHWASEKWDDIPATDVIRGIAAALDVDPDEVLAAAAESCGIVTRELHLDRGTRAVLALLEDRTPEEVAALEAVVRSLTQAMDVGKGAEP